MSGVAAPRRSGWPRAVVQALACGLVSAAAGKALAGDADAAAAGLASFATAATPVPGAPAAPWAFAGLPGQTLPATVFEVTRVDGQPVLQVRAERSYGNLVHRLPGVAAGGLSWRWRVERPLASSDLRTREGDDVALKVCALFDLPRERVPFTERTLLRLAEARSGQALPNATLCYVWAPGWPPGTVLPNAYSRRVRYLTLGAAGGEWQAVRRDLGADFLRAFGDESKVVPPLLAIAVGADADNTGGQSVGWIADLQHQVSR
jgi:hypothetical protein